MYKYLNSTLTAVVHKPTSRCIYLDQPPTIHSENFVKWRDGWTEVIPEKRVVTTPASSTVKPAWIEKVGENYVEHPEETIVVEEVVEITPEQTIVHEPNTTEPYVPPVVVPLTPVQIQQQITDATQARLDAFARTRNYDGILSACTYASSPSPKFATEGQYCVAMRDATWATLYSFMADVQAGTKPFPSGFADVEPLLPTLTWPA